MLELRGCATVVQLFLFKNLSENDACNKKIKLIKLHKSNNGKYGYSISSGGENNILFHL